MLTINFNPFPVLKSDRLLLRRVTTGDAAGILALRSSPEVMKYIPRTLLSSQQQAEEFIAARMNTMIEENRGIDWAITLNSNPQLIGTGGLYHIKPEHHRAEIGYMLLPQYQNKGIVTETIKLILDYAFYTLQMHSIEAVIDPANIPSERVLQKNGFVKEAHFLENEYYNGTYYDSVIYSLLGRNHKR
jgi:ribosomal-protein-alanine N-acetyltransferase